MSKFGTVRITGRANEDGVLARLLQLPRGTRVKSIAHNFRDDTFEFLIEGDWLEEVKEGCAAKEITMHYNSFTGAIHYKQE